MYTACIHYRIFSIQNQTVGCTMKNRVKLWGTKREQTAHKTKFEQEQGTLQEPSSSGKSIERGYLGGKPCPDPGTIGGPVVKTFASGAEVPLAARDRTPVGTDVGVTLIVLQTIEHMPWFHAGI